MSTDTDRLIELPPQGSWPKAMHIFEERSWWAIKAALAAGRPLLLRGEPGSGKSQLARAAAFKLKRAFISTVVHARTSSEDLQYNFDAVARLGEAQTLAARGKADQADQLLNPLRFLSPGPLWWVFDHGLAETQTEDCPGQHRKPLAPDGWDPIQGCVLLIDEIDKAEVDLPNGLLETLGNGAFTVPHLSEAVGINLQYAKPLIIITTNEERELPQAFLRRCMVLHLQPPQEPDKLIAWLIERGEAHFSKQCSLPVLRRAAEQLVEDRDQARNGGLPLPGQAEYLDLLRALVTIAAEEKAKEVEQRQLEILKQIQDFSLGKYEERA